MAVASHLLTSADCSESTSGIWDKVIANRERPGLIAAVEDHTPSIADHSFMVKQGAKACYPPLRPSAYASGTGGNGLRCTARIAGRWAVAELYSTRRD